MKERKTRHAGGASKNRYVDEVVTLPAGNYIVYYQTDGSHSYNHWNSERPNDEENYGITLSGVGENFDTHSVSTFSEESDKNVIAQIIRVGDNKRIRKEFVLDKKTTIRIYAIGEGQNREMFDYGWIENKDNGETEWEMEYGNTERAGGAKKNRKINSTITLEKGEYILRYESDGSHSFGHWNDDPPDDREHWGITLYRE